MVSFELGKEIKKDVIWFFQQHGTKILKVWGSIPHGDSEFFLCPTLLKKQKSSFFKNYIVHLCFDHQRKCYIFTEKRLEVNIISIIFHNYLSMNPCWSSFSDLEMIKCRVTSVKEYSSNCFPRLIEGKNFSSVQSVAHEPFELSFQPWKYHFASLILPVLHMQYRFTT